jgi:hypothetical protein
VRADVFDLVLEGDLNLELEVGVLKSMSVEVIPSFVVNQRPPTLGYLSGLDAKLHRRSDGAGPLSGATFDVGFWLEGKAMRGTVLRVMFQTHSYEYEASDETGVFDRVRMTERVLAGFLGSQWRIGAFTMSTGFGFGGVIGGQKRCFTASELPTSQCADNQLLILAERHVHDPNPDRHSPLVVTDLNGFLGGVRLLGRLSLGVVF